MKTLIKKLVFACLLMMSFCVYSSHPIFQLSTQKSIYTQFSTLRAIDKDSCLTFLSKIQPSIVQGLGRARDACRKTFCAIGASICSHPKLVGLTVLAGACTWLGSWYCSRPATAKKILLWGIKLNCISMIRYALAHGCDVNLDYKLPLRTAIWLNNLSVIRYLIEQGANFLDDALILDRAVWHGNIDIVDYLIQRGANPNTTYCGVPVLYSAVDTGNLPMVRYLVEQRGAALNPPYNGMPVLFRAVQIGNLPMVRYLIEHNVNIDSVWERGKPDEPEVDFRCCYFTRRVNLFPYAIMLGNIEIIRYLVEQGAQVHSIYEGNYRCGITPLQYAANHGQSAVVRLLVEHGALLWRASHEHDPLYEAARGGHEDIVHYLIKHGFYANESHIRTASDFGHHRIADYLRDMVGKRTS